MADTAEKRGQDKNSVFTLTALGLASQDFQLASGELPSPAYCN